MLVAAAGIGKGTGEQVNGSGPQELTACWALGWDGSMLGVGASWDLCLAAKRLIYPCLEWSDCAVTLTQGIDSLGSRSLSG